MKAKVRKLSLSVMQADVLDQDVGAVVYGTDTELHLSPLLLSRAGLSIGREIALIGSCPPGEAVITSAGSLKAAHIIHAVVPRWGDPISRGRLSSAVFHALRLAEEQRIRSLAFPALSTGALGFPIETSASVLIGTIIDYCFEPLRALRSIRLCVDDARTLAAFERELAEQLQALEDEAADAQDSP